jgi:hypothetical protein
MCVQIVALHYSFNGAKRRSEAQFKEKLLNQSCSCMMFCCNASQYYAE